MKKQVKLLLFALLVLVAALTMTVMVSAATEGATTQEEGHYFYFENAGTTYYYTTLTAATNAVPEGGTVYLLDDVVITGYYNMNATKNYTVDGTASKMDDDGNYGHRKDGRYTITFAHTGNYALYYGNTNTTANTGKTVTIKNLELVRKSGNYLVDVYCKNTLNFENCYLQGVNYLVHFRYACTVNFLGDKNVVIATGNDGALRNSSASADAVCNIEGGKFYGGTGGVFYIASGINLNVNVTGGTFFHTGSGKNLIDNDAASCTMNFEAGKIYLLGGTAPDATVFAAADVYEFLTDALTIPANETLVINDMTDTAKYLPDGTTTSVENPGYKSFSVGGYYGAITLGASATLTINEGYYTGKLTMSSANTVTVSDAIFIGSGDRFTMSSSNNTLNLNFGYYSSTGYLITTSSSTGNKFNFNGGFYLAGTSGSSGRWFFYENGSASTITVMGGYFRNGTTAGNYGMFNLNNSSAVVYDGVFEQVSTVAHNNNAIFYVRGNNAKTVDIYNGTFTAGYRVLLQYGGSTTATVKNGTFTAPQQVFALMGASSKLTVENGSFTGTTSVLYASGANSVITLKNGTYTATSSYVYNLDSACTLKLLGGEHTAEKSYALYSSDNKARTIEISGGAKLKGTMGIYFTQGTTTLTVSGEGTEVIGTKYSGIQLGNTATATVKYAVDVKDGAVVKTTGAETNNSFAICLKSITDGSTITLNGGTLQGNTFAAIGVAQTVVATTITVNSGTISTAGRRVIDGAVGSIDPSATTITFNGGIVKNTNANGLSDSDGEHPMFDGITPVFNRVVIISNATKGVAVNVLADGSIPLNDSCATVLSGGDYYYVYTTQQTENTVYDPTNVDDAFAGAAVQITEDPTVSGLRFITVLSEETVAALAALKQSNTLTEFFVGTVIAPADYVAAAGVFTKEALDKLGLEVPYVDIESVVTRRDTDDVSGIPTEWSGALINLKKENFGRKFTAISYITITNAEGSTTYYGAYDMNKNARSIADLAAAALASGKEYSEGQLAVLEAYTSTRVIDLFLIAGQSNAAGTTAFYDGFANTDSRFTEGIPYIHYQGTSAQGTGSSSSPIYRNPVVADSIKLGYGVKTNMFGVEMGMADVLSQHYNAETGRTAAFVRYAWGGSWLTDHSVAHAEGNWCPPSYFEQTGATPLNATKSGMLYDKFIEQVLVSVNYYRNCGYKVNVVGLYWMQGESDFDYVDEYAEVFSYLVSDLRRDISNITEEDKDLNMPVFVGEVSASFNADPDGAAAFLAMQRALPESIANVHIVSQADLGIGNGNGDFAHWSAENMLLIGKVVGTAFYNTCLSNGELLTSPYEMGTPVAEIYDADGALIASFANLSYALNVAPAGATVKLLTDLNLYGPVTVHNANAITLDGNGKTLTALGDECGALYVFGADLTVENLNVITEARTAVGAVTLRAGGDLTWCSGTITAADIAIRAYDAGSVLNVEGGTIATTKSAGSTYYAIAVSASSDVTVNISGGTITGSNVGGALCVQAENTTVTISGGTLTAGGKAAYAIWIQKTTAVLTVTGTPTINGEVQNEGTGYPAA